MRSGLSGAPKPLLIIILVVIAAGSTGAFRHRDRKKCNSQTPVCRSDRFDVVFSHYDDWHCKVFKCKCRDPVAKTCTQGQARLQVDSDGCQYYECPSCPPAPVCQGTQQATFQGNDANMCPVYTCDCPPNPNRPQCGPNQQLQQTTDSSGCPTYFCQQTRVQCPDTPNCNSNQQLVSVGLTGDCQIYKCECLTPAKIACGVGSQARLQDDGLGCQVYKCQENRSPCPPEPTCPSPHQMVSQNGVDGNNCIKYVCKCIPLAPITCPAGFRQVMDTDETCACEYYKCEPNCEQKPNCQSVYQEPVISGTRNNGCPTYSCQCKNPEVISCTLANSHLVLSKATDGSNCDIYVCQGENDGTRSCGAVPNCPAGQPPVLSSYDAQGCPVYVCSGGSGTNCPPAPPCGVGETQQIVGRDTLGCPQYVCNRVGCPAPPNCGNQQAVFSQYLNNCPVYVCQDSRSCPTVPSCPLGQVSFQVGYISGPGSCPQYVCQPNFCPAPAICPANESPNYVTVSNGCVSVTCGNTRSCRGVPACRPGETPQVTGTDSRGCTRYVCYRLGCPNPPTCSLNQLVTVTGYDASNCAVYTCQNDNGCQSPLTCLPSETQLYIGQDNNGCPEYLCHQTGCTPPPTCTVGERLVTTGVNGNCPVYSCQSSTRNCPVQPTCPNGQTPNVVAYDSSSCPVYSCPTGGNVCTQQLPSCPIGQSPISSGTNAAGCPVYVCQFSSRSCPFPPVCSNGRAAAVVGRDTNNCPIYGSCDSVRNIGGNGIIGGNGVIGGNGIIGGNGNIGGNGIIGGNGGVFRNNGIIGGGNGLVGGNGIIGGGNGIIGGNGVIGASGGGFIGGNGIIGGTRNQGSGFFNGGAGQLPATSTCPKEPECQYQQLRIRSQEAQAGGQVCEHYTCISLGDYDGRPPKCHDNPTYCDISQTVETYVQHGSHKPCQRVVCKASNAYDNIFGI